MKLFDAIDDRMRAWIAAQRMFFVATAPLAADGHVNLSPKGLDSFRVLGPREVGYVDFTGSGAETAAHLRENGRIVVMFCAFEGPPRIVRLYGRGTVVARGDAAFTALAAQFPSHEGTRAVIRVELDRIMDSCGYAVPLLAYQGERDQLPKWAAHKGEDGLRTYRDEWNRKSIDGLPALPDEA
jgi:predicted pyridoxine 5'-phosphate oxidase superfamily flavin-nucleotide-binding protein